MKKLIYLLGIIFLIVQSCSTSNESENNPTPDTTTYKQGPNITDIDGNVYSTITINSQTWMQKNLNVNHYKNGDVIPQVINGNLWANLTTGAWCYYENNTANGPIYGKLYNWYAVTDPRGLAPNGWHIPSDNEWTMLTNYLGGELVAGGKMKETGFAHWLDPNTGATNTSGFTGIPIGCRWWQGGIFTSYGNSNSTWWSSTQYDAENAWQRGLNFSTVVVYRDNSHIFKKTMGLSVRCVKN